MLSDMKDREVDIAEQETVSVQISILMHRLSEVRMRICFLVKKLLLTMTMM
jgi:hypothetical protein